MAKDPLKEIGSLIKTTRERLGLSIDALALESRVSTKHIYNIENAVREELPEDTYLVSYLNKLLKTLKISNAEQLINQYRMQEGDFILQTIIDVQETNSGEGIRDGRYFKVYHLYIAFALFILLCCWIIINKANEDYEYSPALSSEPIEVKTSNSFFDILTKLNPIKDDKEKLEDDKNKDKQEAEEKAKEDKELKAKAAENGSNLLLANGATHVQNLQEEKKLSEKQIDVIPPPAPVRKHTLSRGSGAYNVRLSVKDKAWVQIIGVGSKKVLYEGDVSPDQAISALDLKDDVGFVMATGNAGAFDVDVGSGNFKLGESGQLVKWFYPESARSIYKGWSKTQQKN